MWIAVVSLRDLSGGPSRCKNMVLFESHGPLDIRPMHLSVVHLFACVSELMARTSGWCCGTRQDRRSLMPSPRPTTEVRVLETPWTCVWLSLSGCVTRVRSCRRSGLCAGLLHHRQRVLWGHRQLVGESGDGGRGHTHRPGAEQNRSAGRHGYQKVRPKESLLHSICDCRDWCG